MMKDVIARCDQRIAELEERQEKLLEAFMDRRGMNAEERAAMRTRLADTLRRFEAGDFERPVLH